jgi:hypothetical protein
MKKITVLTIPLIMVCIFALAQESPVKIREIGFVFSNFNSFGLRYKRGSEKTLFRITSLVLNGTNTSNEYNNYFLDGNNYKVPSSPTNTIGASLNFGFEKRKPINDKFYFYFGIDWLNSFTYSDKNTVTPAYFSIEDHSNNVYTVYSAEVNNTNKQESWTVNTGFGIVVGAAYKINNSFSVAAELIPSVSYKFSKTNSAITDYGVHWLYNNSTGSVIPEPNQYISTDIRQTIINKGFTYGLTNATASITLAYKF